MKKANWIHMPHAGHFICGARCEFKLNTYVGHYIVSTVGQMPDTLREGFYSEIGCDRKFETMVFPATKSEHKCCPFKMTGGGDDVDFKGYNTADEAAAGHMAMCEKWSKIGRSNGRAYL